MDVRIREDYLGQAIKLHGKYPVADAHLDLAGEILLRHQAGERNVVKNYYLPHFKTSGIKLVVSSVYVENGELTHGWDNALAQIQALKEDIADLRQVRLVLTGEELKKTIEEGKVAVLLSMEGLAPIGEDIDKINELYSLGVRGAALTWSRANALATGCCTATKRIQIPGKITKLGEKAIRRLEELSMFLDVSHLNDEGYGQIFALTERPFIASHTGSRYVYDNYRNMTDEQIKNLARRGGVMGVNGCKYIAGSLAGNHIEMLCNHIEHEAELIGAEHIGFGFDLCDSYGRARAALGGLPEGEREDCLLHHGQIPLVTAALLQRGMAVADVSRIMGNNFIDYFLRIL